MPAEVVQGGSARELGGVVIRVGEERAFVPSAIALSVLPVPEMARLPGAAKSIVGVTVLRGEAIPVVSLGPSRSAMLVCTYLGEPFGLVGLEVLATGRFPLARSPSLHGERILFGDDEVHPFDVAAVFAAAFGDVAAPRA